MGGFGLPGGRVKSTGECVLSDLSAADRAAVASLFRGPAGAGGSRAVRDGFRYRLTLLSGGRPRTIDVPEAVVPAAIRDCAVDRLT